MEFARILRSLWQRVAGRLQLRSRYTRELQNEIVRLREENRALMNSILGLAGIPPMRVAAGTQISASASRVASVGANLGSPGRDRVRPRNGAMATGVTNSEVIPLRRRSWQQLGRVREIEDARASRRERETDAEAFPAPRNIVPRL